jgi:hypothetical protein
LNSGALVKEEEKTISNEQTTTTLLKVETKIKNHGFVRWATLQGVGVSGDVLGPDGDRVWL